MWLVWCGALLLVLKWFEVDPVATWSWWWILAPLAAAFVWFEFFERMFRCIANVALPGEAACFACCESILSATAEANAGRNDAMIHPAAWTSAGDCMFST